MEGEHMVTEAGPEGAAMGLAEAALEIIDILRGQPASGGTRPDNWDRIVGIIAQHDHLPDGEVKAIEKAIAEAYRGWSDVQRRSIWYETDSGMTDDDSLCDTSFNGIGYALQIEMLDEVTRAAWQDAMELRNRMARRPQRKRAARKGKAGAFGRKPGDCRSPQ